jgi:hypothetical protein
VEKVYQTLVPQQVRVCASEWRRAHVASVQFPWLCMTRVFSTCVHMEHTPNPQGHPHGQVHEQTCESVRLLQFGDEVGDLIEHLLALAHETLGLVDRVNDRGVVASTEETGYGRVAQLGHVAEDVHGDLPG